MEGKLGKVKKTLDEINKMVKNYDPAIKEAAFNFLVQKFLSEGKEERFEQKSGELIKREDIGVGPKMTLVELFEKVKPKKHVDKVIVFGYYLEKIKGMDSFTPADIGKCYYDLRTDESNTSQMIVLNIRKGYMMSAKGSRGGKQHYVITRKAEQYILNGLKLLKE